MAEAGKRSRRPSFYQVVLEGSPKTALGLLAGLRLGAGLPEDTYFCLEESLEDESLGQRLSELIRRHPRSCVFVVESRLQKLLNRLAGPIEQEIGLKLSGSRHIRSASLEFSFHAYARRYGEEILGDLRGLPAGLRLEGMKTKETEDPRAAGVEAYAPAHDYEIEGSGRITGRVDMLVPARRQLSRRRLLKLEQIELKLA
jgi:hypothetical protein